MQKEWSMYRELAVMSGRENARSQSSIHGPMKF